MGVSFTTSVDNNCLLSYAIATNPDPLQVSPLQGNPSVAALTIVVSNGTTDAIYCNQITFSFDIGPLAQNLTNVSTGILAAASPSDQWKIASTDAGVFVATPAQPQYNLITTNGLVFQLYNIQVNQQVGTFAFNVDENSSTDKVNFTDYNNVYNVAKFPYGFFVGNFTANKAQVNNGESALLTWIGSDLAKYTIIYDSQAPVDVTNTRSWNTPPLNHDTNFILTASVQSQGETVNDYLSTVVTVANPILNATSLTVLQTSALQGNTTVGTAAANAILAVNGTLSTSGKATLNSLDTAGNALIGGTLDVSGKSSLANVSTGAIVASNATVTGTLSVSQTSTLADTLIRGTLSSSGAVGLIGNAQSINPGGFVAKTDGFIIGYIGFGGSNSNSRSLGWIYGSTAGYTVQVTGGNNVYWLSIGTWSSSWSTSGMPSSFILPVKKGNSCSVNLQLPSNNNNEVNPSASFYWVPFGVGNLANTLEKITDLEPEYIDVPSSVMNESKRDKRDITEFIDVLEEFVQNPGHNQIREHLTQVAEKLFGIPKENDLA
jgi:hypothetical protein